MPRPAPQCKEGSMRLCLVEDNAVSALEPLTLTRPVFDLLLGASSLGHKIARSFGVGPGPARRGVVVRPYLAAARRSRDPQTTVNDGDWLARGPVLVANGRWVPPTGFDRPGALQGAPPLGLCAAQPALPWVGPNDPVALHAGEVEASIVHGHSNKYHEGFLGHAYVGEWVNLGAITSNSDLRNDYGEVHVPIAGDPVATGQAKVGCFVGDHTRTGLGSMLNTGTAIGVMCNVLPAGLLLPKHIPSFTSVMYGRVAPGFA